jgi:hypothetical protein
MKIPSSVQITITKTDEPNGMVNEFIDEFIEKLFRVHRKYDIQLIINTKNTF